MKQKISFFVIFLVACFLVSDLEAQRGRRGGGGRSFSGGASHRTPSMSRPQTSNRSMPSSRGGLQTRGGASQNRSMQANRGDGFSNQRLNTNRNAGAGKRGNNFGGLQNAQGRPTNRAFSQPSQNQLNNFLNPAAGRCGGLVRLSPPDN